MIVEGWISELEMQWILSYMPEDKGTIVETGSATGRLFAYLYEFKPKWKYVGVDAWDKEIVYLQKDYTKDYFDEDALDYKKRITQDIFVKNCPFAEAHNCYFEDWKPTVQNVDVFSMGAINNWIVWKDVYDKARQITKPGGLIFGRNIWDKLHREAILETIKDMQVIETMGGGFLIKND